MPSSPYIDEQVSQCTAARPALTEYTGTSRDLCKYLEARNDPVLIVEQDYLLKIILIGESGVGKTCLLHHYLSSEFNSNSPHVRRQLHESLSRLWSMIRQ